ncbi:ABC transporter permease [Paenibacillus shunpengii]|uniref:ABC transporter permease n=1 Tax=Paenibacillus shunpengii TaxID=2054424 RepID=A0ABW5STQ4_9BACL
MAKLVKLMALEWKKLKHKMVISEVVIYTLVIMFMPMIFIRTLPEFGQSYETVITLMMSIQMGFILFGASLINQVVIEEYKYKTMSLSYGYPISRRKLMLAKVLFIAAFVFVCTFVSCILSGAATFLLNQSFHFIDGQLSLSDIAAYFSRSLIQSIIITLASLIPFFIFGVWLRATIPAVLCAIFLMQFQNFGFLLDMDLHTDLVNIVLCLLGLGSVYLAIATVDTRIGEI